MPLKLATEEGVGSEFYCAGEKEFRLEKLALNLELVNESRICIWCFVWYEIISQVTSLGQGVGGGVAGEVGWMGI